MKLKKVVIIGMGLIGGSIGKALLNSGLAEEVIGVCRRESSLERAVREKTLTQGYVNDYKNALPGAELIIIATPVNTVMAVLKDISLVIKDTKIIVTDVGSTKKDIVECASQFKDNFSFVGGHPLAGSEKAGVEYAKEDLFKDSLCVLTKSASTTDDAIEKVKKLWEDMGAKIKVITPDEHDQILALTSHLPHIVAYALAGTLKEGNSSYAATGFKDTTRIASSDPLLWSDIFLSNSGNVLKSIEKFKELLSGIEQDIKDNNKQSLEDKLKAYKELRDGLF